MERSFQREDRTAEGDTRARVLSAAADLFAARGFAGTSISAIRDASGVLPSSMYWEFGSKEGILAAVLEDSAGKWLAQAAKSAQLAWEQSRAARRPPLAAYFANLAEELTERPDFLRLLLLLSLERREADSDTIETVRRVRAKAVSGMARALRHDLAGREVGDDAIEEIARMTLAFADGAFVAAQIDPETADLRRMFAIFYAGMSAALEVEGVGVLQQAGAT